MNMKPDSAKNWVGWNIFSCDQPIFNRKAIKESLLVTPLSALSSLFLMLGLMQNQMLGTDTKCCNAPTSDGLSEGMVAS